MNKKVCICIISSLLIVIACVFLINSQFNLKETSNKTQTEKTQTEEIQTKETITPKEAEDLCYSVMGKADKDTGFIFSFSVTGTTEKEEKEYYIVRASWLVNNSHLSYIGDFFVSVDGKEIYDGVALPDEIKIEKLIWQK